MTLQVAALTFYRDIALPPFVALRHLILSTTSPADLPIATLENASALQTLSLRIFGTYADWSHKDIDVSSLHALKHVRIENFAPRKLHVPDGCLLHVVWDGDYTDESRFRRWAQVQSLWQAQCNHLGSLQIRFQDGRFQELNIAVLKTILTGNQELGYISLWIPKLGNEQQPFLVHSSSCQMLALAERVRIRSERVCSIKVTSMQPKWKNLSIDAARVNLEVEDAAAFVRSLDNLRIQGVTTHGFSSLSMMYELHQVGRKCFVNRQPEDPAKGTPQGFAFGTLLDGTAQVRFAELMCCGCSSCLACLSLGGKLSRVSQQSRACWDVLEYDLS